MFLIHLMVVLGAFFAWVKVLAEFRDCISYLEVYLEEPKFNVTCLLIQMCSYASIIKAVLKKAARAFF